METKHKTLAECMDEVARKHGHATFNRVRFAGTEAQLKIMDEAAELYTGPLKQQNEDLQKFKDYVHKRLDDAGIEKEPNGEHSKAGCRIGDRLDIVLKQSSPVSLEVEKILNEIIKFGNAGKVVASIDSHVSELARKALKILQSKQPASIVWLTNEEIRPIAIQLSEKYGCGFGSMAEIFRIVQSKLRKRVNVVDPVRFLIWCEENDWTLIQAPGGIHEGNFQQKGKYYSTGQQLLQKYIDHLTSKTK